MRKLWNTSLVMAMAAGILVSGVTGASGAPPLYSKFSLLGIYRVSFTVFSAASGKLESGVGIFVADGNGSISGTETFNTGTTVCNVSVTGTYTVNQNGTGTLNATFTSPAAGCSGTFNSSLLLYDGGDLVRTVSTDSGFVTISEEWRRSAE
jgi:hypothetical protein